MISQTPKDCSNCGPKGRAGRDGNAPPTADFSDVRAIREVLAGNRHAFAELTAKYQERLFNSLAYTLQNRNEAEEVVQEAFMQAYTKLSTFRHESTFYTWLYRVAWNIASTRRRRRRHEVSLEYLCETLGAEMPEAPADATEDREDSIYRVRKTLAELGEKFRIVLVLRHLEGHSYDVIAEMLDLPVGTVRSRIHRGRRELRRKLQEHLRAVQ